MNGEEEGAPVHLATEYLVSASQGRECCGEEPCRFEELALLKPLQILNFVSATERLAVDHFREGVQ